MVCHFLFFSLPILCFWLFTPIFGHLYTTQATCIEQVSEPFSREFAQPWPLLFSYPWLLPFHLRLHHLQCTQSSITPYLYLQFQHLFFIFSLTLFASRSICHRCPTHTFCIIVSIPQLLSNWYDDTQFEEEEEEEEEEEDGVWISVLGLVFGFGFFLPFGKGNS